MKKFFRLFIEGRVGKIDVLLIESLFGQLNGFANTINMKWITKEPPTLFFDGILTNSQLFCAFIKVPLQPYSLFGGYTAIFFDFAKCSADVTNCNAKSAILYDVVHGGERNNDY